MRSNDIKREELTLFFWAKRLVNRSPCAAPSKRKRTAILFASRTLLLSRLSKNQLFDEAYYDFKEESWFPLYLKQITRQASEDDADGVDGGENHQVFRQVAVRAKENEQPQPRAGEG